MNPGSVTSSGRVAVVTGAGRGLGRAFAHALLRDGFRVALLGRTMATLQEAAGEEERARPVRCDVTEEASVAEAFRAVLETWGRVDVLVNNAGEFGPTGDPDEITADAWRHTVAVNLTGSFLCAREAFRIMKAQDPRGGRIINNGSVSAHSPRPGSAAYTASKHAVTGLTKSLSLDGRPYDITCGQLDIGNAATEMTAQFGKGVRQADGSIHPEPTFDAAYAADAVVQMARLPLGVSVPSMTILAAGMPFEGRG
ncbi:SDR family oxidoreductase [Leekyejoonella antrihumi]|uniref:SDR family oxidoreductase n=1 Tax=Leekyejoonella antrihumi TaxID=1660198 RepID=A0A563DYY3_9MICO|nr:SDR family oxidoreductase [Leekyejoonella antrihumi]TWP35437.1 SDR family oxidoreductase [Leekyejoonella antrihumi]